jgi:hypothetical protein
MFESHVSFSTNSAVVPHPQLRDDDWKLLESTGQLHPDRQDESKSVR